MPKKRSQKSLNNPLGAKELAVNIPAGAPVPQSIHLEQFNNPMAAPPSVSRFTPVISTEDVVRELQHTAQQWRIVCFAIAAHLQDKDRVFEREVVRKEKMKVLKPDLFVDRKVDDNEFDG